MTPNNVRIDGVYLGKPTAELVLRTLFLSRYFRTESVTDNPIGLGKSSTIRMNKTMDSAAKL